MTDDKERFSRRKSKVKDLMQYTYLIKGFLKIIFDLVHGRVNFYSRLPFQFFLPVLIREKKGLTRDKVSRCAGPRRLAANESPEIRRGCS